MIRFHVWGREIPASLNALQGDLNRLYEHYRHSARPGDPEATSAWTPAVDLAETAEEIAVWADLPGIDPAEVEVSLTGRVLTLRGENSRDDATGDRPRTLEERPSGPFHRQIDLPADVDADAVRAEARFGVLSIRLPKLKSAQPRTIPIQGG